MFLPFINLTCYQLVKLVTLTALNQALNQSIHNRAIPQSDPPPISCIITDAGSLFQGTNLSQALIG